MSRRIYVGRISNRARDKDVERLFRNFGRVREIVLKNGYGFVEFEDQRDADDAIHELSGRELCGERIIVERARGPGRGRGREGSDRGSYDRNSYRGDYSSSSRTPSWLDKKSDSRYGPPTRTEHRLIVENLSSSVSWQDLKDYMRQVGEVTYADAHRDQKNEGVVEFASYSDMKAALEKLDDTELNGRRIKLVEDKPKKKRNRSRSGSRSRSRSRSRSGGRSRSRSKSRSRSASRSKSRSRSRSPAPAKEQPAKRSSRSKSRSHSRSKSRSRSRSLIKDDPPTKKTSPARSSKSRSASPAERDGTPESNQDDHAD